jgi:hypothetical protein
MGQEVLRLKEAKGGLIKMDVSALQAGRYQVLISSDSGSFYRGSILIN